MIVHNAHASQAEFLALDDALSQLETYLSEPSDTLMDPHEAAFVRTLTSVATLHLHAHHSRSDPGSRERCFSAVHAVAAAAQYLKAGVQVRAAVDPSLAVFCVRLFSCRAI